MISIIVPIYNTEKYLHKCVESIRNQTYENLQIILVDDGSPDNCPMLCDQMAMVDKRIVVIHKKNGGLSDARNAGLDAAEGEYICFLDSDDYYEPNTIETAVLAIRRHNCDAVIWGYYADFYSSEEILIRSEIKTVSESIRFYGTPIKWNNNLLGLTGYAWNKLYRRKFIGSSRFPKGVSLVEDLLFNAPLFLKSNNLIYISEALTHYIQRPRRTLGNSYYEDYLDLKLKAITYQNSLLQHWGIKEEIVMNYISKSKLSIIWNSIKNISISNIEIYQKKQKIKQLLQSTKVKEILKIKAELDIKDRLKKILLKQASPSILIKIITLR